LFITKIFESAGALSQNLHESQL